MKKLFAIFTLAITTLLAGCSDNEISKIHNGLKDKSLSYQVDVNGIDKYGYPFQYSYQVMKNGKAYSCYSPGQLYEYIDRDSIITIDHTYEEYITFYKDTKAVDSEVDWYSIMSASMSNRKEYDIYSPFWNKRNYRDYRQLTDTTIDNIQYSRVNATYKFVMSSTDDTCNNCEYTYTFLINKSNKMISSIIARPSDKSNCHCFDQLIEYHYTDFSFDENQHTIHKLFERTNPSHSLFSTHNHNNLPSSKVTQSDNEKELTDELLNFPLVGVMGDTVTIQNIPGWVLLESWRYGCPSCKEFFDKVFMTEYNIFKNNNITILSINTGAGNINRLKDTVSCYAQQFSFRCAKGFDKYIKTSPYPIYYLISPDKRITYVKEGIIDDFDTIIQLTKGISLSETP